MTDETQTWAAGTKAAGTDETEPTQRHTGVDLSGWANPGDPDLVETEAGPLTEQAPAPAARTAYTRTRLETGLETGGVFMLPWYVVPNYIDGGVSAQIIDAEGSYVATFDSVSAANAVVDRMNDPRCRPVNRDSG